MRNLFELQFLEFTIEHYTQRVAEAVGPAKWHCRKQLHQLKQRLITFYN